MNVRKTVNNIKNRFKNRFKKQVIDLPDGSNIIVKLRPKLNIKKTKVILEYSKQIDDVSIDLTIKGQPIRCYQDGIHTNLNEENTFQAEASATFKW